MKLGLSAPHRAANPLSVGCYADGPDALLEVIQPFYAFRGLVVASPVWYPNISLETRRKLFNFIKNVLDADAFDYEGVEKYLER